MIDRAPILILLILVPTCLALASQSAASCFFPYANTKEHTIPIDLTPHRKENLHIWAGDADGEFGTETICNASISIPLSLFPSSRLVSRPADFASDIREILSEWSISKCDVQVWINNDVGEELTDRESCLTETFRYAGDSVWSAGSENYCMDESGA